jgi:hypothetical protein
MRSRIISGLLALTLLAGFALGIPGERSSNAAACQTAAATRACGNVDFFSSVIEDVKSARESVASTLRTVSDQVRTFDKFVSQLATATPAK